MTRVLAALALLAAPAFADAPADFTSADAALHATVAASRLRALPAAFVPAAPTAKGASISFRCKSADGRVDLRASLSADLRTLTNGWGGRSARLDPSTPFVDDRCGKTAWAPASALNFEVTAPHDWGQDILQLHAADFDARAGTFKANLHLCSYDGDWSSSSDADLVCDLAKS